MKGFFICLKLFLRYSFIKIKGMSTSKWIYLAYAVIGLYLVGVVAGITYLVVIMSEPFALLGLSDGLATLLMFLACFVVLIMGVLSFISTMFFNKDIEFLSALPISGSAIFFAKLAYIYIIDAAIVTAVLLAPFIAMGIVLQAGVLFYVGVVLGIITLPIFPLMLASILSVPLMRVVSVFKNRGALTSVVVILLFGAIFGGYYAALGSASNSGAEISAEEAMFNLYNTFERVMLVAVPLAAISRFATSTPVFKLNAVMSAFANLGIFVLSILALTAVVMLLSRYIYLKGAALQLEGAKRVQTGKERYSQESAFKSLMIKEWREMIRTPSFAFNCLSGCVLAPVLMAFFAFGGQGSELAGVDAVSNLGANTVMLFVLTAVALAMGSSFNIGACTTITREGGKFYYSKLLPVDYQTQIRAKKYVYCGISLLSSIICCAVMFVATLNFIGSLLALLVVNAYGYAFVCFAMNLDLSKPKLNWTSFSEIKNSKNATIPVFVSMGTSFLIGTLMVMALIWIKNTTLAVVAVWSVLGALTATLAVIAHRLLNKNIDRNFERIEL